MLWCVWDLTLLFELYACCRQVLASPALFADLLVITARGSTDPAACSVIQAVATIFKQCFRSTIAVSLVVR